MYENYGYEIGEIAENYSYEIGDEGWVDGEWVEITEDNCDEVDGYDEDDYPY